MAATAIVIPMEAAERAVAPWRLLHTADGADGMPAHVTLIHPFVDEALLLPEHVDELHAAVAPFVIELRGFGRFEGPPPVLFLAPTPPEPILAMIDAIVQRFPHHPPFGGAHDRVIPHLTIASTAEPGALGRAERAVAEHLPIIAAVDAVWIVRHDLLQGWQTMHRIELGRQRRGATRSSEPAPR